MGHNYIGRSYMGHDCMKGEWLGGFADGKGDTSSDMMCTALMRECGLGSFSAEQLRQWQRSRVISFWYNIRRFGNVRSNPHRMFDRMFHRRKVHDAALGLGISKGRRVGSADDPCAADAPARMGRGHLWAAARTAEGIPRGGEGRPKHQVSSHSL